MNDAKDMVKAVREGSNPKQVLTEDMGYQVALTLFEGSNPKQVLTEDMGYQIALTLLMGEASHNAAVPKYLAMEKLLDDDEQSSKLFQDIAKYFMKKFALSRNEGDALTRIRDLVQRGHKDPGLLRNHIFKAANDLKMKLPSSMF